MFLSKIGYKVNAILNITDIDQKIIDRLPEQTLPSLLQFTQNFTDKFLEDMKSLGIRSYTSDNIHKVTDNLDIIENMIDTLVNNESAYQTSDGSVYFDSSKIINYPFVEPSDDSNYSSSRNLIKSDDVKSNKDFALWKARDGNSFNLDSKFGKGLCGWHIECSGICAKHLGRVDIHMGGSDLKFPHHTSSILQSEAYNPDQIFGKYWIHMGFLNFRDNIMSKSLGNTLKLEDVKVNHKLLRMYFLSKSYHSNFDYSNDELDLLRKDFANLHLLYNKLSYKFYKNKTSKVSLDHYIYDDILKVISNNFNVTSAFHLLTSYVDKFMKSYLSD